MPIQPQRDIPLAKHTSFRVGGRARYFFEATTDADITQAVAWAADAQVALHVFGRGSNLVVADSGVAGLALRIATQGISEEDLGYCAKLRANAGVAWDDLVKFAVERNLAGIECLSGIPGSVGATPIQNVGAYGQEISQTITRVTVFDRFTQKRQTLERSDCNFGYRDSRFKSHEPNRYVILNLELELNRVAPAPPQHSELAASLAHLGGRNPTVLDVRAAVMNLRAQKSMLVQDAADTLRSAGSFFVNPIVDADIANALRKREGAQMPTFPQADGRIKLSAGWLIEHAGWSRGQREGNVGLSPHHCLVLVAYERAEAHDVVMLAERIRESVLRRFAIELRPEPSFWGFDALDRGLPSLEEGVPPTLGSASWPMRDKNC